MNKSEAIRRLDAIEKEQAELRKIIEKGDKIVYDEHKIYIGMYRGDPYLLVGLSASKYFRFHPFIESNSEIGYTTPKATGQECIDYHIASGFDINVFYNRKEAFQFFIDHL